MLDVLKRHEVQVLRKAGHTLAEIVKVSGVSESSVRRVIAETPVTDASNDAAVAERGIGRPSKVEAFRAFVVDTLKEDAELMSLEILRRARLKGYYGGKSALYDLIKALRPAPTRPLVRFEGLPAEFSQHDFGQVDVRFVDGSKKRVHFFCSRLKYSRAAEVTLVDNEQVETLVRTLCDHFAVWQGVPLVAVFDRPKTVAIAWRRDGVVTQWNPVFADFVLQMGVGVEVCWPASGNQKGSVESIVKWVKGSFFKQRRFIDMEDLRAQLAEWLVEINQKLPSRATGIVPSVRYAEEKPRMRPLKVAPTDLALRVPSTVGPMGNVLYETNRYSMPPSAIGIPGTLFVYRDRMHIVAGKFDAKHPRFPDGAEETSTLPDHRSDMAQVVFGKRAKLYFKREQIVGLGSDAHAFLTELVHRRPKLWPSEVEELFRLLEAVGDAQVRDAIAEALREKTIGAEYVRRKLATALAQAKQNPPPNKPISKATPASPKSKSQLELPL
jgi:transposase